MNLCSLTKFWHRSALTVEFDVRILTMNTNSASEFCQCTSTSEFCRWTQICELRDCICKMDDITHTHTPASIYTHLHTHTHTYALSHMHAHTRTQTTPSRCVLFAVYRRGIMPRYLPSKVSILFTALTKCKTKYRTCSILNSTNNSGVLFRNIQILFTYWWIPHELRLSFRTWLTCRTRIYVLKVTVT